MRLMNSVLNRFFAAAVRVNPKRRRRSRRGLLQQAIVEAMEPRLFLSASQTTYSGGLSIVTGLSLSDPQFGYAIPSSNFSAIDTGFGQAAYSVNITGVGDPSDLVWSLWDTSNNLITSGTFSTSQTTTLGQTFIASSGPQILNINDDSGNLDYYVKVSYDGGYGDAYDGQTVALDVNYGNDDIRAIDLRDANNSNNVVTTTSIGSWPELYAYDQGDGTSAFKVEILAKQAETWGDSSAAQSVAQDDMIWKLWEMGWGYGGGVYHYGPIEMATGHFDQMSGPDNPYAYVSDSTITVENGQDYYVTVGHGDQPYDDNDYYAIVQPQVDAGDSTPTAMSLTDSANPSNVVTTYTQVYNWDVPTLIPDDSNDPGHATYQLSVAGYGDSAKNLIWSVWNDDNTTMLDSGSFPLNQSGDRWAGDLFTGQGVDGSESTSISIDATHPEWNTDHVYVGYDTNGDGLLEPDGDVLLQSDVALYVPPSLTSLLGKSLQNPSSNTVFAQNSSPRNLTLSMSGTAARFTVTPAWINPVSSIGGDSRWTLTGPAGQNGSFSSTTDPSSPTPITISLTTPGNYVFRAWFDANSNGTADSGEVVQEIDLHVVTPSEQIPILTGATSSLEGSIYTLTFNRTSSGAQAINYITVNWGDGSTSSGTSLAAMTHRYADGTATGSSYTISVTGLWDADAAYTTGLPSKTVTIFDVPPTFSATAGSSIPGGNLVQYVLTRSDPGADTVTDVVVNWGDGQTQAMGSLVSVLSLTHVYASSSSYTITAGVVDNDGTYSAPSTAVVVSTTDWSAITTQVTQDTTPPTITSFNVSSYSSSGVNLSWTAEDNVGIEHIQILRNGLPIADLTGAAATASSYTDSTVNASTSYSYSIISYDLAGNASAPESLSEDAQTDPSWAEPAPSSNLYAPIVSPSEVVLRWTPSSGNSAAVVAGYEVKRSDWGAPVFVTGTTYTDESLPGWWDPYNALEYTVTAVSNSGSYAVESSDNPSILVRYPTQPTTTVASENDQYIPQSYLDYFYGTGVGGALTGLTPRLREIAHQLGSSEVPSAQQWLDVSGLGLSAGSADLVITAAGFDYLRSEPNVHFLDSNSNGRYDPGELVWIGHDGSFGNVYDSSKDIPLTSTAPSNGMFGSSGVYYLPSGSTWTYTQGDEILADLSQVKGIPDGYAFYDENGNGKWDGYTDGAGSGGTSGEPIWVDSGDHIYHAGTSVLYFAGDRTPPNGQIGKTTGLYYQDVDGKRIVWADQTNFQQDFAAFYQGIATALDDGDTPSKLGSVVAGAADHWSTASGTVYVSNVSKFVTGAGTHFTSEVQIGDWMGIGGRWYQVDQIFSDTSLTLDIPTNPSNYTWPIDTGVPYNYSTANWTLIPTLNDTQNGMTLNYETGVPTNQSPIFREQFVELKNALDLMAGYVSGSLGTSLGAVPTGSFYHSVEMDVRNVVPDSNLDGIVNVPVDMMSLGNDSGLITVDPQRGMAQVYIPLNVTVDPEAPIHEYLLQGAFGAASGDDALASTYRTGPDVNQDGISWGFSGDERVAVNMFIDTPENHIARMTVYRPGGNAVTFDFAYDEETQAFSEWGYPVGQRDGSRTYVLHATPTTGSYGSIFTVDGWASFDLRFADGTRHLFDNIGELQKIALADGYEVSVPAYLPTSSLPTNSTKYQITLNYSDGHLASVSYLSTLVAGVTDSMTTTISYASAGSGFSLITGLSKYVSVDEPDGVIQTAGLNISKEVQELSYSVSGGANGDSTNTITVSNNGSQNTLVRAGSASDATLTYTSGGASSSDEYVYNASGMLTSFVHHLGSSTATTAYFYGEGSGRYPSNSAAQWGKVTQIVYPDGSWEGYAYDPDTGWLTAYVTPFKGTAASGSPDFSDWVNGHSGVNVESYSYDNNESGGDAANPMAVVEFPRETVDTTDGTILGVTFDRYATVFNGYPGSEYTRVVTTRTGEFATLSSADLAGYTWDDAVYQSTWKRDITTQAGLVVDNDTSTSPLGQVVDMASASESTGFIYETITRIGQAGGTLTVSSRTVTPFGTVSASSTHDVLDGSLTSDFQSTYNGVGAVLSTYDWVSDQEEQWTYVLNGSVSFAGPLAVINADGMETDFTYDAAGRVKTQTAIGDTTHGFSTITTTFTYDGDGNVTGTSTSGGTHTVTTSATYDAMGRVTSSTNELGKVTQFNYSSGSGVNTTTAVYNYGSTDNATIVTQTYVDGSIKSTSGNAVDQVNYDYGVAGTMGYFERTVTHTNATDTTSTSAGMVSTTYYNSLGLPYRDEESGPSGNLVTLSKYDTYGRLIEQDDQAQGTVTRTEYDPVTGNVLSTYTLGHNTLTQDESVTGPVSSALSGGLQLATGVSHTNYENGREVSVDSTSLDGRTSWSVDWNGGSPLLSSSTTSSRSADTPGGWIATTSYSDGTYAISTYVNESLTLTQQFSSSGTLLSDTNYTYDDLWRTHTATTWTGGTGTNSTTTSVTYTYLNNGQVSRIDYSDGTSEVVNSWSGATDQPTSITQRDGTTITMTYDAQGNLLSQSGGGTTATTSTTDKVTGESTLTLYRDGNVNNTSSSNTEVTSWHTDPTTGNLTSKTYADGSSEGFYYNASGQLYQSVYGGVTATYGYTSDGVQNSVTYTQSGGDTLAYATDAFDQWGNPLVITETDTPSWGYGATTITETFAYDAINHQVTHETFNYATVSDKLLGLSTTYSHSGTTANMVTSVAIRQTSASDSSYAGTTLVGATYGYDDAGRVSSVTSTSTANGTTTTFGYDDGTGAMSTVSTAATSGDIVTTYHYNATNGHLESIVTMQGSTIIYEEDNTYPDAGDAHYDQIARQQVTALVTNGTSSPTTQQYYVTYTYDSQNQLTGMVTTSGVYGSTESHSTLASEVFTYDALGNRTSSGGYYPIAEYYTDATNELFSYMAGISYDARGNMTYVQNYFNYDLVNMYSYAYDALNRLVSATPDDHGQDKAVYTYDSENRRTSETLYAWDASALGGAGDWSSTPASVTDYLYNGQTLMAEVNGLTGKMIKSYQWDPTKENGVGGLLCITTYDSSGAVTGKYKPVYDSNANVVALIDLSTGNVVANYSYTAYGQCTATGPDADVCMFRFGGMYWQASSNLYYDHARDYDPFWGRFVERDPSGEDNSLNLEVYCGNDPINKIDPTGLATQEEILAAFKYMYGAIGQQLLQSFLGSNSNYGPSQLQFITGTADTISGGYWFGYSHPYTINIVQTFSWNGKEQDVSAATAANALCRRLIDMMSLDGGMRNYWLDHFMPGGTSKTDDELWQMYQTAVKQNFAAAAASAATLAYAYVQGITMFNEGANVAVSIGQLMDGDLSAALNLIPLASKIASKVGGMVVAKVGTEVVEIDSKLAQCLTEDGCFARGTLVATEHGARPIESIQAGERVWAFDIQTREWSLQAVITPVSIDYVGKLVTVSMVAGDLTCTPGHPFWVIEGTGLRDRPTPEEIPVNEQFAFSIGRWVAARDLRWGDVLLTKSGGGVQILAVETDVSNTAVFNLAVAAAHTFAAGRAQILVHNITPLCKAAIEDAIQLKAQLAAEENLARVNLSRKVLIQEPLVADGARRIAVLDTQTGRVLVGNATTGTHVDVVTMYGLNAEEQGRFVGGFIDTPGGVPTWVDVSGTYHNAGFANMDYVRGAGIRVPN